MLPKSWQLGAEAAGALQQGLRQAELCTKVLLEESGLCCLWSALPSAAGGVVCSVSLSKAHGAAAAAARRAGAAMAASWHFENVTLPSSFCTALFKSSATALLTGFELCFPYTCCSFSPQRLSGNISRMKGCPQE